MDSSHGTDGGEALFGVDVPVDAPVLDVVIEAAGVAAEVVVGEGGVAGRRHEDAILTAMGEM